MARKRNSTRGDLDRFGAYRVVEKLASGGMADIFRVRRSDVPDASYALKRIRGDCDDDVEFRKMLMDEAKICSFLEHPNIASVVEVVETDGCLGLILEYVDGFDLGRLERFARETSHAFSLEVAIYIVREVLEALDYAHAARDELGGYLSIVHRDVSPGNVMVDVGGRIKVVDFGIARAHNRLAKTEAGNVKGKFRYMAPEQIRGDVTGPHTDVYSSAVVFWEILSGRRIYDDLSIAQLMIRVAHAEIPPLSEVRADLPEALHRVFEKATTMAPEDRYQSARAFADALDGVLSKYDRAKCRASLAELVLAARRRESERGFDRAKHRARLASEHDLECAILAALERPDRIERIDVEEDALMMAEPMTPAARLPSTVD